MGYQYKLDYGGQSVTLDSDEELTDEEIQDAADQSFEGLSDEPAKSKEPGVVDMLAPSLNRPLSDAEKARMETRPNAGQYVPSGPNTWTPQTDPRIIEGAMDVVNTSTRAVGAAVPSSLTRGKNPDGTTKSFKEAMADSQTGLFRPIREKYEERLGQNIATMKSETNVFKKVLAGVGAGLDGIGLLAATALEPGAGSVAKAFGRASKFALTGGKSAAKSIANTYIKEVGVPESALQRMADNPEAIKAGSLHDAEEWRTIVADKIQGMKQPQLDQLTKDERKVMETFQERLADILDKKTGATLEAQSELDSKIMQLDQEVRDFMGNIDAAKGKNLEALSAADRKSFSEYQEKIAEIKSARDGSVGAVKEALGKRLDELNREVDAMLENAKASKSFMSGNLAAEKSAKEAGIKADAVEGKAAVTASAPDEILGGAPRAKPVEAGDRIQSSLQQAEEGLSAKYGELKDEGFKFKEARDSVIPGSRNKVRDAWNRVKQKYAAEKGENIVSAKDDAAFEKLINDNAPGTGPSTIGGLLNIRKHVGKVIYGKTGIKESDDLFQSVNRGLKEDFYASLNDEIGTELHGFYKRNGVPPDIASQIVDSWDNFNRQYSGIRSGLETVERGIRFSSQGGKTERYASALGKMGVNDLKKAKTATLSSESTRPVWDALKDAYLNDLIDNASPGGVFSPKKFGKDWSELMDKDKDRLIAILGEQKVNEVNSYYKKLGTSLDEIDAVATGSLDDLARAISEKSAAYASKVETAKGGAGAYKGLQAKSLKSAADEEMSSAYGAADASIKSEKGSLEASRSARAGERAAFDEKAKTAQNAVAAFRNAERRGARSEAAAQKAAAGREARVAKGQAKEVRDASVEALDKRKDEIESIGKIILSGTERNLNVAMTHANMTGPQRKKVVEKLTELFGAEEAQKIQDSYFAKALGAKDGSIPLFTRMPTGRALFMGFITGHPLAAALATSPQIAAKAMRYGSAPAGRLGAAIERVTESPRLMNLFKMLNGVKKVESRNRVILRIMQEMQKEGIEIPEELPTPPAGDTATEPAEEQVDEFPDDFEPDPVSGEE